MDAKEVKIEQIKELKERTGLGIMDCKKALIANEGDIDKAIEYLRKEGILKAAKKSARKANDGLVHSYIHFTKRLGVLIEVNCETDFVAKTPEFEKLVHELALHVGACEPQFVSKDDIPADFIEKEKEIYRAQLAETKKPAEVIEKIVEGKLNKFFEENCMLYQQMFGADPAKTVEEAIKENITKFGENIVVNRFALFKIGE